MKVFANFRLAMRLCLVALVATVGAVSVQAQDEGKLDLNGKPNFGEVRLKSGFQPDPNTKNLTAGGNLKITVKNVSGNMTKNPDVRLFFEANLNLPLTISAKSKTDTVLIINLPNGTWVANDDSDGLNPVITIPNPKSGRYEIWVGTFVGADAVAPATLYISEINKNAQAQDEGKLDLNGKPNFGEVTLKSGFQPDPFTKNLTAGGNLKVTVKNVSGNMTKNPDFRLRFEADLNLPLTIYAKSKTDTVLIVNLPNGTWVANDDSDGLDPVVTIPNPKSGRYEIWVGTFIAADATAPATLYISEIYKK